MRALELVVFVNRAREVRAESSNFSLPGYGEEINARFSDFPVITAIFISSRANHRGTFPGFGTTIGEDKNAFLKNAGCRSINSIPIAQPIECA